MASSPVGFSLWGRRSSSVNSQGTEHQETAVDALASPQTGPQQSSGDGRHLSSSFSSTGHREPIRSFIHGSVRDHLTPLDSARNARDVREDTAELASWLLSDRQKKQNLGFLTRRRSRSSYRIREPAATDTDEEEDRNHDRDRIVELSEPASPTPGGPVSQDGPSMLSSLFQRPPPGSRQEPRKDISKPSAWFQVDESPLPKDDEIPEQPSLPKPLLEVTESSPLLGSSRSTTSSYICLREDVDIERQKDQPQRQWFGGIGETGNRVARAFKVAASPKLWDRRAVWQNAVVNPVSCVPAVIVGLLLNILDALSYGMILFPLGKPIFANLGSAGIAIFYVSTIISQLTFSFGSIFRGGIGSELIEVVPFFHNMAQTITEYVGEDKPDAVIATTIVSYALSSMMTGTVFFLMGKFKFGYMVGFIPRHILIGCIGGVGLFLVTTGFEVSARLDGSLEYDLETLHKLLRADTIPLWSLPLALAVAMFYGQSKIKSKYFLPLYILTIPAIFYFFVFSLDDLDPDSLRNGGWIFHGPPEGEPWWYFYTLYKFNLVHWGAVAATIPAMLALTFFGTLHVPINVPALALITGEDHADLDRELKLHGYSNFLSGLAGSIQNYLVYANTVLVMRSGGDSRLAGIMLALSTFLVMTIGPSVIGFIPVMMVGTIIFSLGFELCLESIWLPRKKLKTAEYLTVIVIVLVMGMYDFVVGIGVGILLAFVSLIFQTSRVTAVRGAHSGEIVTSTVRRNPSQHHYLQQVGRQIYIVKLTGYLFFGTIVSVEEKIRALIDDDAFGERPIKYLIIDLWHVTGIDYSAGEAFNTISRLLDNKGIVLVLSSADPECEVGQTLRAVGLGEEQIEVVMLPDLNSALESCENELLKTLYAKQEALSSGGHTRTPSLNVPVPPSQPSHLDVPFNSPRQTHLHEAAQNSLNQAEVQPPTRWQSFKEPLRLMLQVFQGLSDKNEDFWFRAVPYFVKKQDKQGTVLYKRGEPANGFYLIEQGILRADYDLPQGRLSENIVAGTTCGEMPFFSESHCTATVIVERDAILWVMGKESWERLQKKEPDVAHEILRASLKLTSERMTAITSYILTIAG